MLLLAARALLYGVGRGPGGTRGDPQAPSQGDGPGSSPSRSRWWLQAEPQDSPQGCRHCRQGVPRGQAGLQGL